MGSNEMFTPSPTAFATTFTMRGTGGSAVTTDVSGVPGTTGTPGSGAPPAPVLPPVLPVPVVEAPEPGLGAVSVVEQASIPTPKTTRPPSIVQFIRLAMANPHFREEDKGPY